MIVQVHQKGGGFRGALEYALQPEKSPRIIGGSALGRDVGELCNEFGALRQLRPDLTRPVMHFSLSAAPGESLSDREWIRAVAIALKKFGLADTAYVVIRHYDAEHDHLHVIASRVTIDSKLVPDPYDALRAQEAGRAIEQELGLERVHSSWERGVERAPRGLTKAQAGIWERTGEEPFQVAVQRVAGNSIRTAGSWADLKQRLADVGLFLRPKRGGLVMTDGVDHIAISRVDRGSSHTKLTERFGMTYDEYQRTRGRQPGITLSAEAGRAGPGRADAEGGDRTAGRRATDGDARVGGDAPEARERSSSLGQIGGPTGTGGSGDRLDQLEDLADGHGHGSGGGSGSSVGPETPRDHLTEVIRRLDLLSQREALSREIRWLLDQIAEANQAKPRLLKHDETLRMGPERVRQLKEQFDGIGMSAHEAAKLRNFVKGAASELYDLILKRPGLEPDARVRLLELVSTLQGRGRTSRPYPAKGGLEL